MATKATASSGRKGNDTTPTAAPVGTAIEGDEVHLGDVDGPANQPPDLAPNAPFYIAIHPARWHVRDGLLLPQIKIIPMIAGVEGGSFSGRSTGAVNMDAPKGRAAARGYTIVPTALGPNGGSYLRSVDVPGGKHYLTAWDTAHSGEKSTEFDRQAFHDWVWGHVNAGKLPGPSLVGLRRERANVADQHLKAASKAKVSAEAEARAKTTELALQVIDAYMATLKKGKAAAVRASSEDLPE